MGFTRSLIMNFVTDFFSILQFDFKRDFKSKDLSIDRDINLTEKLKNAVFLYQNLNKASTSFYLITRELNDNEFESVRKFIWNENETDLILYFPYQGAPLKLIYAKASPKLDVSSCELDSFATTDADLVKIENIKHWQFESGSFWLNYHSFVNKSIFRGIDKELVSTLNALKNELHNLLSTLISNNEKLTETVQALIDRTLYIKYLEDNHIINSVFYDYYFQNGSLDYKQLLENANHDDINKLFTKIHEIFNNNLFNQPTIDNQYLTSEVCSLISQSFSANLASGQLKLYDFQFDVLPVEFISYIYEIFLSEKQKSNGIYYTPKKLAQLIIDDVIHEDVIGSILDPSCGSGMFLIVGYHRLLEIAQKQKLEPEDIFEKIQFRIKLLADNIFGIEKQLTAQRFTLFSLSLQIFKNINPEKIKEYIASQLKENKRIDLFNQSSFFDNIICTNTLNQKEVPFEERYFDYIVGNPPFFGIPNTNAFSVEISFLNEYKVSFDDKEVKIKNVVGQHQISQCFLIKIKDWSSENTRFGFVCNSSNFYNDNSSDFQHFFLSKYNVEKLYELSRVKNILFAKAKESVVSLIFSNKITLNNQIEYYPVDLGLFSEKPFELLIIQEKSIVNIFQKKLIDEEIKLRDFLVGNAYDRLIVNNLSSNDILHDYLQIVEGTKDTVNNGLQIVGKEQIIKEFNLSADNWSSLTKKERSVYSSKFKEKYTSTSKNVKFPKGLLEPKNLVNFSSTAPQTYLGDISNFQRIRNKNIYELPKILINRTGSVLKANFSKDKVYYNFDIYSIFIEEKNKIDVYLVTALINSSLINYFVDLSFRKRVKGSFTKIGYDAIKNIPIPKVYNDTLVSQISQISQDLTNKKYEYSDDIAHQLNELIFDLYDLSFTEKQRVRDYFLLKSKIGRSKIILEKYQTAFIDTISFYLHNSIKIEFSEPYFNLRVAKILLNENNSDTPSANKTSQFILQEIFEQNPSENLLFSQEKIYGKDCVYIIKPDINLNWTETKAFEDGQEIIKHLMSYTNGERIH